MDGCMGGIRIIVQIGILETFLETENFFGFFLAGQ